MNYSPKNYKPLLDTLENIDSNASDIGYVRFDTDLEEAKEIVDSLHREVNNSASNIRGLSTEGLSSLHSIIYGDFVISQERYIELVNIGYEEDLFPFDEWLDITSDLKWLTYNNVNIARNFSNLEEEKDIKVQLMRNIEHLWSCVNRTVSHENDKRHFFSDCIELAQNLPIEYKDKFIERFVFSDNIDINLINFLEDKKDIPEYKLDLTKAGYYIDYLFRKSDINDKKLHDIFKLLKENSNDLILNKIGHVLVGQHSNSFLTFYESKLHQVDNKDLETLFDFDREYNLGLSKHILRNLKTIQSHTYSTDKSKLDNICLFFERGCAVLELSKKIPQKEDTIRLRKI